MNIRDYLSESRIELGAELCTKDEALDRLIRLQKTSGAIHNPRALRREIMAREEMGSSAVSCRIAIPDVAHSGAIKTSVSALTVRDGIEYGAPDKRPVKLLFLIAGKSGSSEHIYVKARLLHLLMDSEFSARLCAAQSKKEFLYLIERRESIRCAPIQPDKRYDCRKYLK